MQRPINFICALLLLGSTADAQISFGPTAGFHLTSYNFVINGKRMNDDNRTTVVNGRAGIAADMRAFKRFHFQPSVLYTSNGYYSTTNFNFALRQFHVTAVEVPLMLTYHGGMKNQSHFFVGAGVYGAYNVGGKMKVLVTDIRGQVIDEVKAPFTYGADSPAHLRRTTAGVLLSGGYQTKKGVFVRIHYQHGLKNMYPAPVSASYSITSSNYGLMLGYLFQPKNKKERIQQAKKPKPSY